MTAVLEHQLIARLAAGLPRSPAQINGLHESDAELLRLPGSDLVLALTTDALAEELASGLYRDPGLIGWMLVTVTASDLAAVGADPLGLLICETLPPGADGDWIAALQRGIADASVAYGCRCSAAIPTPARRRTSPRPRSASSGGDRSRAAASGRATCCSRRARSAVGAHSPSPSSWHPTGRTRCRSGRWRACGKECCCARSRPPAWTRATARSPPWTS
jgi:hypothetical protein